MINIEQPLNHNIKTTKYLRHITQEQINQNQLTDRQTKYVRHVKDRDIGTYNFVQNYQVIFAKVKLCPTLCSKCGPASKFFVAPEPYIQELYDKNCDWKQLPTTNYEYPKFDKTIFDFSNISVPHPGQEAQYI